MPALTLAQAIAELGTPDGRTVHENIRSPLSEKQVTQNNLHYGALFLVFFAQDLYQFNFETANASILGLPHRLDASWYDDVRLWQPEQFRELLQTSRIESHGYRIDNDENGEEMIIAVPASKSYWFFINKKLYKVSWKWKRDDYIYFSSALSAKLLWS